MNNFILCLCLFIGVEGMAQCNLSYKSLNLSSIESDCNNLQFKSNISNSILVNAKCGKYRFTPPIIDIPIITHLEPIEELSNIVISPNPFTDFIDVMIDNNDDDWYYSVYDLLGSPIVKKRKIVGHEHFRVEMGDISIGTYVLKIQSSLRDIESHLIIKME